MSHHVRCFAVILWSVWLLAWPVIAKAKEPSPQASTQTRTIFLLRQLAVDASELRPSQRETINDAVDEAINSIAKQRRDEAHWSLLQLGSIYLGEAVGETLECSIKDQGRLILPKIRKAQSWATTHCLEMARTFKGDEPEPVTTSAEHRSTDICFSVVDFRRKLARLASEIDRGFVCGK